MEDNKIKALKSVLDIDNFGDYKFFDNDFQNAQAMSAFLSEYAKCLFDVDTDHKTNPIADTFYKFLKNGSDKYIALVTVAQEHIDINKLIGSTFMHYEDSNMYEIDEVISFQRLNATQELFHAEENYISHGRFNVDITYFKVSMAKGAHSDHLMVKFEDPDFIEEVSFKNLRILPYRCNNASFGPCEYNEMKDVSNDFIKDTMNLVVEANIENFNSIAKYYHKQIIKNEANQETEEILSKFNDSVRALYEL
jgi:hypothetical protein